MKDARPEDKAPADRRQGLLTEAMAHPLRARVLYALSERPDVTVRQVAERLEESPRRVRHQIGVLVEAGLARITSEAMSRGNLERRFGAEAPLVVEDDTKVTPTLRAQMAMPIVRLVLEDIRAAAAAGLTGEAAGRCQVRYYGEVDDRGLEELADIHLHAYEEMSHAMTAARQRLADRGETGTEVISALFFFEAPVWASRSGQK